MSEDQWDQSEVKTHRVVSLWALLREQGKSKRKDGWKKVELNYRDF